MREPKHFFFHTTLTLLTQFDWIFSAILLYQILLTIWWIYCFNRKMNRIEIGISWNYFTSLFAIWTLEWLWSKFRITSRDRHEWKCNQHHCDELANYSVFKRWKCWCDVEPRIVRPIIVSFDPFRFRFLSP